MSSTQDAGVVKRVNSAHEGKARILESLGRHFVSISWMLLFRSTGSGFVTGVSTEEFPITAHSVLKHPENTGATTQIRDPHSVCLLAPIPSHPEVSHAQLGR